MTLITVAMKVTTDGLRLSQPTGTRARALRSTLTRMYVCACAQAVPTRSTISCTSAGRSIRARARRCRASRRASSRSPPRSPDADDVPIRNEMRLPRAQSLVSMRVCVCCGGGVIIIIALQRRARSSSHRRRRARCSRARRRAWWRRAPASRLTRAARTQARACSATLTEMIADKHNNTACEVRADDNGVTCRRQSSAMRNSTTRRSTASLTPNCARDHEMRDRAHRDRTSRSAASSSHGATSTSTSYVQ
jgi:hypothetical protein